MADTGRLLFRGSILRVIALVTSVVTAFFLMPYIIHVLGDRWYGMWVLVGTLMGYYSLLDLGLGSAAHRFTAHALARGDHDEVNRVMSTSFALFLGIGVAAFLVSAVVASAAPWFLKDSAEIDVFRIVVIIGGVDIFVSFAIASFNGVVTAKFRFDLVSIIDLFASLTRSGPSVYRTRIWHCRACVDYTCCEYVSPGRGVHLGSEFIT
ncbi:MAG: hypothetical protein VCD66_08090 [Alphaproteobacteria bacterium]|jgi:O-antigen/teichoic acid export membrane protein